jgi:hypothetical protein
LLKDAPPKASKKLTTTRDLPQTVAEKISIRKINFMDCSFHLFRIYERVCGTFFLLVMGLR